MKFKEMGYYLIQIGLYFSTKEDTTLEENTLHNNIKNYLLQAYLYLADYNKISNLIENNEVNDIKGADDKFLTKKEVISTYYPLFTNYGLSQAIHTQNLPYHKRGNKYFFKKSEIDNWISNKNDNDTKRTYKFV